MILLPTIININTNISNNNNIIIIIIKNNILPKVKPMMLLLLCLRLPNGLENPAPNPENLTPPRSKTSPLPSLPLTPPPPEAIPPSSLP